MEIEKDQLAEIIRDRRTLKGMTQIELSEKTGISLRSIQRVEKGEVLPRSFTVKALAAVLGFNPENLHKIPENDTPETSGKARKFILSIGSSLTILLLALAFLAQSATFPETSFEFYLFVAGVITLITILQWFIWVEPKSGDRK